MASKTVTFEQAETKRQQAVELMNRLGNADAADEFDNMTTQEYIDHKGLNVINNNPRRKCFMPNNSPTKAELQEQLDAIEDILDSAYQVETSREDMAAAISQALDILQEGEEEEEENVDEDLDDNGD